MPRRGSLALRRRVPAIAALFLFAATKSAHANPPVGASADSLYNVISTVMPGSGIRLELSEGEVAGKFLRNTSDSLFLAVHSQEYPVLLPQVNKLWDRGRSTSQGMLIGAAIGFVGFAVGVSGSSNGDAGGSAVIAGVAGGVAGGFLGSLVGLAVPRWRLRFDSPTSTAYDSTPMADGTLPSEELEKDTARFSTSWTLELLGGFASDDMDTWFGGRIMRVLNGFQLGVEVSGFNKSSYDAIYDVTTTEQLLGVSFLCGPRFRLGGARPYLMVGPSVMREKVEREASDALDAYKEEKTIVGFAAASGVRFGGRRWHLLVEAKYQAMARGYYDDVLGVVGGAGLDF